MSYLKFDKDLMINLEYSLYRNVLRTNRKGAYQNTSISGCNTSKYQGLLVMPVPFLDDDNHLILSSIDETVIQHGAHFNLGIHKYNDDNYSPKGHKYIREFTIDSVPKTIYRVGGVILSKEIMFSSKENRLMIRYKLMDAHSPTIMRFKPCMAFRNISQLTMQNDQVDRSYRKVENGISTSMYYGYPEFFMQFNKQVDFVYQPYWNKGVEYIQDMQNGDTFKEDLYVPGYFELPISKGEEVIFSAGDILVDTTTLADEFNAELQKRTPRSSFYNCLKNSAHQFYYIPKTDEVYLLAGYPWFKVRARDQFISLPGCTLSVGRRDDFVAIMNSSIPHIHDFMNNRPRRNIIKQIEDPDLLLWVIWSLQQYWKEDREGFKERYADFVFSIVDYILSNKHPNLIVDKENGLLLTDGRNVAVSWMNAMQNGKPVIPRSGYLVEFNALWYNALKFSEEVADAVKQEGKATRYGERASIVRQSFVETFLNNAGYLYDYVDGTYTDWNVRPNMIFAVSADYSPLERHQRKSVIDYVTKELLTPVGIRSLSPKGYNYHPRYAGTTEEKEYAYFNGCAFPWLIGPYIEAYLKVFGKSGLSLADRIMIELEDQMQNDCIGTLSEFYDSSPPFYAHGGFSFAMSVSETLRAKRLIRSFE
ncbi:glycogen debranching enzyme N-terminal domain-containing protein [Petrimonas mucosa]|jgi:predicted glycogen debranching enzyme|uniref:Putative glycogen debranching enzyme, type n=2 Tax=Petrimonas mucosa TaxID=1642646 RepID=A0A1G4G6N2_9BACT|nr:amylo-alpha-1,6-glucosidase [Petrimonas mucosa]MDD3560178.1 amylo-alpha-1,6-glucosidase [Petrimonas mucosa]SCM57437.1 putative glycogen debranching enzyme, type {ECO:0000313/EMBL:CEA16290,1} [Petrimonas mucosa]SFU33161.1 glycogen debranching enzyme, putative [Porphyromonadaceae bacterium KHP3R9]HHT29160.1 4-alpha-glucanotransferase [Petrimonas mucosa]